MIPCDDVRGGGAYLLDVAYPVPDVVEGFLVGDVIRQHDALQTQSTAQLPVGPSNEHRRR